MMDAGFLNPGAAQLVARRMLLRRRISIAASLCSRILHRLDQRGQADSELPAACPACRRDLGIDDGKGDVGRGTINVRIRDDVREQELLEGADLVLQLLDALFGEMGHGLFSVGGDGLNATAAPASPESKKGRSK